LVLVELQDLDQRDQGQVQLKQIRDLLLYLEQLLLHLIQQLEVEVAVQVMIVLIKTTGKMEDLAEDLVVILVLVLQDLELRVKEMMVVLVILYQEEVVEVNLLLELHLQETLALLQEMLEQVEQELHLQ
tara:strand:+ start:136 stop:522 length:387 start_codon:yes stop_codon:yes gene_type:complete